MISFSGIHISFNLRNIIRWLTKNVFYALFAQLFFLIIFHSILLSTLFFAINFICAMNYAGTEKIQLHFSSWTFSLLFLINSTSVTTEKKYIFSRQVSRRWNGYTYIDFFHSSFHFEFDMLALHLIPFLDDLQTWSRKRDHKMLVYYSDQIVRLNINYKLFCARYFWFEN